MGVFDQAARYATLAEPEPVLSRLLAGSGATLRFREWVDTRTTPCPGERDRTADRVAALVNESAPDQPWLLVFEFQAQHDPDKLDATLAEAARLRIEVRHGADRRGKYNVCTALVYLRGRCPQTVLDMTLPGGAGTRHAALVWNVEEDAADQALTAVTAGAATWGLLSWIPLMHGGGEVATIARWKELASALPDRRVRGDLGRIALTFAELAGCYSAWEQALEGWDMTESKVVNRWIDEARQQERISLSRKRLLQLAQGRFPGAIPTEVVDLIGRQDSEEMLEDWFLAAVSAPSAEQFLSIIRR
ncbi:MAG TPA: hypothetical protein VKA46_16115 [Gemmataceae bacterium]|nr:hypothetical protein [Gemmataceae bacterium]